MGTGQKWEQRITTRSKPDKQSQTGPGQSQAFARQGRKGQDKMSIMVGSREWLGLGQYKTNKQIKRDMTKCIDYDQVWTNVWPAHVQ